MQDGFEDDFDRFCQIAKNPVSHQRRGQLNPNSSYETSDSPISNNLYRSRSVRERPSIRLSPTRNLTADNTTDSIVVPGQGTANLQHRDSKIIRVRSFKRTTKGVVCSKDTLEVSGKNVDMDRASEATSIGLPVASGTMDNFVAGDHSSLLPGQSNRPPTGRSAKEQNNNSVEKKLPEYKVQVLGMEGVGKSSLVQHLLVPEYLVFQYEEGDPDQTNRSMRVLVDNKESVLQLIDSESQEMLTVGQTNFVDAYLIMYAVDDRQSFDACRKILANLVLTNMEAPVVILIGNKADLVRSRAVTLEEGKRLASVYSLKFKEISTSLDHCVDELLVLLVTEIRNHQKWNDRTGGPCNMPGGGLGGSGTGSKGRVLRRLHNSHLRSSLRSKVSHNPVSRFFSRHFNKSSENVADTLHQDYSDIDYSN